MSTWMTRAAIGAAVLLAFLVGFIVGAVACDMADQRESALS
jgi:hypothetical protein